MNGEKILARQSGSEVELDYINVLLKDIIRFRTLLKVNNDYLFNILK